MVYLNPFQYDCLRNHMQLFTSLAVSMASMNIGFSLGWPNSSIPKLLAQNSPVPLQYGELNLLVNAPLLLGMALCPLATWIAQKRGRNTCILISGVLGIFGWLLLAQVTNFWFLFSGRMILGMSGSFTMPIASMYVSEISEDAKRGKYLALSAASQSGGLVFTFCFGAFFTISQLAYICACFPMVFLGMATFAPESPHYNLLCGDEKTARMNLQRLRGDRDVDEEFQRICTSVEYRTANRASVLDVVRIRSNRRALLIIMGLMAAQQFSGSMVFLMFNQVIFLKAETSTDPATASLIIGIVHFSSQLLSMRSYDKFGRKLMLLISSGASSIVLFWMGGFFYMKEVLSYDSPAIMWMPLTTMILFNLTEFGLIMVPHIYIGELFPTHIRAAAMTILYLFLGFCTLASSELFLVLYSHFDLYIIMWLFASVCASSTIFVSIFLPETRGKSFDEIQFILSK